MSPPALLIRADAGHIPLADNTVDLVITSPPYFGQRLYRDDGTAYDGQIGAEPTPWEFLHALWSVTGELARVLTPAGSMLVNLGDKYVGYSGEKWGNGRSLRGASKRTTSRVPPTGPKSAPDVYGLPNKTLMGLPWLYALGCTGALDTLMGEVLGAIYTGPRSPGVHDAAGELVRLILRAEIVWSKVNCMPESVTDRVRRTHEQWFHLTATDRYRAALDELRVPHTGGAHAGRKDGGAPPDGRLAGLTSVGERGGPLKATDPDLFNPLGKLPGSVWEMTSEPFRAPEFFVDGRPLGTPTTGQRSSLDRGDGPAGLFDAGTRLEATGPAAATRRHLWEMAETAHAAGESLRVFTVNHYAAFPSEWPRRFILAHTPNGICLDCGEGRWPTVEKDATEDRPGRVQGRGGDNHEHAHGQDGRAGDRRVSSATITGYSCACPDCSAPTRPAVVLDPFVGTGTVPMVARALGRTGVGLDLSGDYLALARWRIYSSGGGAKALDRTHRENQGSLL